MMRLSGHFFLGIHHLKFISQGFGGYEIKGMEILVATIWTERRALWLDSSNAKSSIFCPNFWWRWHTHKHILMHIFTRTDVQIYYESYNCDIMSSSSITGDIASSEGIWVQANLRWVMVGIALANWFVAQGAIKGEAPFVDCWLCSTGPSDLAPRGKRRWSLRSSLWSKFWWNDC